MIVSFLHKGLQAFYRTGAIRGIQPAHAKKISIVLSLLDVAKEPSDLNLPGLHLHSLKGTLRGHWSVRVNGNWRITFRFIGADIELVNYQDYH